MRTVPPAPSGTFGATPWADPSFRALPPPGGFLFSITSKFFFRGVCLYFRYLCYRTLLFISTGNFYRGCRNIQWVVTGCDQLLHHFKLAFKRPRPSQILIVSTTCASR